MVCDLTTGLVGYWSMTGNANDSSGNGFDGSVTGATLTTDKNSVSNQAYDFDGVNDAIEISHDSDLMPTAQISISAWIYIPVTEPTSGIGTIVQKGYANAEGTEGYVFRVNWKSNPNNVELHFSTYSSGGEPKVTVNAASTGMSGGNWYHVVAVKDDTTYKIYIDAVEKGSTTNATDLNVSTQQLTIGASYINSLTRFFEGKIDEVRIYNYALDLGTITALYEGYDAPTCGICDVTSDIEILYSFSGNGDDDSGNNRDATLIGSPSYTTDKDSVSNQALNLNGTTQYAESGYNLTGAQSVSMWFNTSTSGSYSTLFEEENFGTKDGWKVLFYNDNTLRLSIYNSGYRQISIIASAGVYNDGNWHHIVVTFDGTDNWRIYVDGSLLLIKTQMMTAPTTNYNFGGGDGNFLPGKIDECRVYSRELSQESITTLYTGYDAPSCGVTPTSTSQSLSYGGGL